MSVNPDEQPPSYEEAVGTSPTASLVPVLNEQPNNVEDNSSTAPVSATQEEAEEKNKQKAEEAGWRSDLLQPAGATGGDPPTSLGAGQVDGQGAACGTSAEVPSLEERNLRKAEEAGWKADMMFPTPGPSAGPGKIRPAPLVLPPGLQPLLLLDTLFLRGVYERGKGRRYKITNKEGGAILYARSIHRGHHHPKDIQLYDSTRTAVVGQLVFSQAADNSMYANLECPSKVSLSTIRAEDFVVQSNTPDNSPNQGAVQNSVKYTICNILGEAVFEVSAPTNTNFQEVQIKVYSILAPGTPVADIWWNVNEETGGQDEMQSTFGERDDSSDERRVKITFPLDLEVKMKAAIVAMCMVKDKIDHRLEKRGSQVSNAYRGVSNQALGIAFGHHGRRRHHRF